MPGDGPLDAEVLVLGISPGRVEDEKGLPFQGQSGQLLKAVVAQNQLVVRYTNLARCRPPENRDPTAAEMRACRPYLDSELSCMPNLKYVVALGSLPMKAMGVVGSVTDLAGVPRKVVVQVGTVESVYHHPGRVNYEYDEHGNVIGEFEEPGQDEPYEEPLLKHLTVIPVYHPAAVLRRQTYLSTWESHWNQIREIVRPSKTSFSDKVGAKLYPNGLEGKDWRTL